MPAWWNRCCAHWVSCSHPRRPSWRGKPKESCMNEAVAVMNDQGLAEICRLLEREDMLLSSTAVWLSSRPGFYGDLLALDAIAVSRERGLDTHYAAAYDSRRGGEEWVGQSSTREE